MPINTSFAGNIPWLITEPPSAALARGAQVGANIARAIGQRAALNQRAAEWMAEQDDRSAMLALRNAEAAGRSAEEKRKAAAEARRLQGAALFEQIRTDALSNNVPESDANAQAMMGSIHLLHPEGIPQTVSRENAIVAKSVEGDARREADWQKTKAVLEAKTTDLDAKNASSEKIQKDRDAAHWQRTLLNNFTREAIAAKRDAGNNEGRVISRGEFVARHAGTAARTAKDNGQTLTLIDATRMAGEAWDSEIGPNAGQSPTAAAPVEDVGATKARAVIADLKELETEGWTKATVTKGKVTGNKEWSPWGTPMDQLIEKYGRIAKEPASKSTSSNKGPVRLKASDIK